MKIRKSSLKVARSDATSKRQSITKLRPADILFAQGQRSFKQKQYTAAAAKFRHSLRIDSQQANVFYLLGCCMEKTNKIPAAIGYYESALKLSPTLGCAHFNLGKLVSQTWRKRTEHFKAIHHFKCVIEDPTTGRQNKEVAERELGNLQSHYIHLVEGAAGLRPLLRPWSVSPQLILIKKEKLPA